MDEFNELLTRAGMFVAGSSSIVWGVTEIVKKAFHDEKAKDQYLPFVAAGVALLLGGFAWGYGGSFEFAALAPYLLGSVIILAGGTAIHVKTNKHKSKKPKPHGKR